VAARRPGRLTGSAVRLDLVRRELAQGAETIAALVAGVTAEEARRRPAPDAWSLLEVVCHLHDEEREDFRPRLDVVRPFLLRKVEAQVMPFDLFYFFAPHRDEFLKGALRSAFYYASVALGAPLYVYGLWRWLRSPSSLPVVGLWWAGVIAAFTLARIPAQPWYPLMLAPLPAVLAAGAFDGSLHPTAQSPRGGDPGLRSGRRAPGLMQHITLPGD